MPHHAGPFWTQGASLNKFGRVEVNKTMLHTIYQGSRPCGFRQEEFFHVFPILAYVKHMTPGAGSFFTQVA